MMDRYHMVRYVSVTPAPSGYVAVYVHGETTSTVDVVAMGIRETWDSYDCNTCQFTPGNGDVDWMSEVVWLVSAGHIGLETPDFDVDNCVGVYRLVDLDDEFRATLIADYRKLQDIRRNMEQRRAAAAKAEAP